MKYLKTLLYLLVPLLSLNLIITLLYFFNIINNNIIDYFKLLILLISIFISGIYIGKNSNEKGYIEGIKVGLGISIMLIVLGLILRIDFSIKNLLYYIIIIVTSMSGSMLGINKKRN